MTDPTKVCARCKGAKSLWYDEVIKDWRLPPCPDCNSGLPVVPPLPVEQQIKNAKIAAYDKAIIILQNIQRGCMGGTVQRLRDAIELIKYEKRKL